MLRKRTRSVQKDQQGHLTMSDSGCESHFQSDNHRTCSIAGVSGLFVGLSSKGLLDGDSVRSPTSPLDFRVFPNLANSNKSLMSSQNGQQKNWDCHKVGLSIVDSLDDDMKGYGGVIGPSESKNILFAPQVRINTPAFRAHSNSFEAPRSLPRNFGIFPNSYTKTPLHKGSSGVLFEIGESPFEPETRIWSCSLDSCKTYSTLSRFAHLKSKEISSSGNFQLDNNTTTEVNSPIHPLGGSPNSNNFSPKNSSLTNSISFSSSNGLIGGPSASEIELSEDYTCIISYGPNPKKTHIYGDCVLECPFNDLQNVGKNHRNEVKWPQAVPSSMVPSGYRTNDFLSFCDYCHKKLEEGKDIYMYRGEKAFCSLACRSQEIVIEEESNKTNDTTSEDAPKEDRGEDVFSSGVFYA